MSSVVAFCNLTLMSAVAPISAVLVALSLAWPLSAAAVTISLLDGFDVRSAVSALEVKVDVASFPDSGSVVAESGGNKSTTNYDLSEAGFEFSISHSKGPSLGDAALSTATVFFSVDSRIDYSLQGSYSLDDPLPPLVPPMGQRILAARSVELHQERLGGRP